MNRTDMCKQIYSRAFIANFFKYVILAIICYFVRNYLETKYAIVFPETEVFLRIVDYVLLLALIGGIIGAIFFILPILSVLIPTIALVIVDVVFCFKNQILHVGLEILFSILLVCMFAVMYNTTCNLKLIVDRNRHVTELYYGYLTVLEDANITIEQYNVVQDFLREIDRKYGTDKTFKEKVVGLFKGDGFKNAEYYQENEEFVPFYSIENISGISGLGMFDSIFNKYNQAENEINKCVNKILNEDKLRKEGLEGKLKISQDLYENENKINEKDLPENIKEVLRNASKNIFDKTLREKKYKKY